MSERVVARRRYDAKRREEQPSRAWYKSTRWKAKRRSQLRNVPHCEACASDDPPRKRAATIVDHVEPHRGDWAKFWGGRLQSLCKPCHDSRKQADERRGYSVAAASDGWPEDPAHPFNANP